jgi:hypothetical protein
MVCCHTTTLSVAIKNIGATASSQRGSLARRGGDGAD